MPARKPICVRPFRRRARDVVGARHSVPWGAQPRDSVRARNQVNRPTREECLALVLHRGAMPMRAQPLRVRARHGPIARRRAEWPVRLEIARPTPPRPAMPRPYTTTRPVVGARHSVPWGAQPRDSVRARNQVNRPTREECLALVLRRAARCPCVRNRCASGRGIAQSHAAARNGRYDWKSRSRHRHARQCLALTQGRDACHRRGACCPSARSCRA